MLNASNSIFVVFTKEEVNEGVQQALQKIKDGTFNSKEISIAFLEKIQESRKVLVEWVQKQSNIPQLNEKFTNFIMSGEFCDHLGWQTKTKVIK